MTWYHMTIPEAVLFSDKWEHRKSLVCVTDVSLQQRGCLFQNSLPITIRYKLHCEVLKSNTKLRLKGRSTNHVK